MADTNLNTFVNGVATYLATSIFPSIVLGFAAKGVQTSVDELLAMTNTPVVRGAVPTTVAPPVPAMAFGGAVPAMAQTVTPTATRKTAATATPISGRTCMYQFKRGENKGKYCGKPTAPGTEFCNACVKTRKNLAKEVAATPGGVPALPGAAPMGYAPPTAAAPGPGAAGPAQPGQLSVVEYDADRGLYREPNHNFIVRQNQQGVVVVLGRLSEVDNKIVALTPQEQATALSIGLVMGETQAAPAVPAAVPAIPTAVPAIPAIPTATVQTPLAPTGAPALPTIPPLAAPGAAPAAVQNVPTIPGIPQIQ